jgi:DNA-binding LacI/PurR family transcriptional regulator
MLTAVERAINGSGYHLVFGNSDANLEKENLVLRGLAHRNMLGFIVQPVISSQANRELAQIPTRGQPLVLIDREVPGVTSDLVTADHYNGGELCTRHLLKQGFTNIAYLTMNVMKLSSIAGRYSGYSAAMHEAGLRPRPPVLISSLGEIGYNELLQSIPEENSTVDGEIAAFLLGPDRPQAIIANNDAMALMVLRIAHELNINIPGDLALVGYDNLVFSEGHGLTTVDQHADLIGKEAVRLLMKRIAGDRSEPEHVVVPVELVVRVTSRKHLQRSTL